MVSSEAVLEIVPEGETELLAGLLQAEEGIPRGAPRLAGGGSANRASLHLVAKVILTQVGVERDYGALEHQE